MSLPPADEAFEATGFRRGTITPLGSSTAWPVVVDEVLTTRAEITLGSGTHDVAIGVDARALVAALDSTVADVSDPE
jgi:prolyl-tRNA editing enzyme YbaK/EbsC (Cys-tRNA(Pro) deacylase)